MYTINSQNKLFSGISAGLLRALLILHPVPAAYNLGRMEPLWGAPELHNRSQLRRGYSKPRRK
jgi:hypothetical protein